MKDWRQRITTNPDQCGGRLCIRGMRIRVMDVLVLLAASLAMNFGRVARPEKEDIEASINYARGKINDPIVTA